MVLYLLFLLNYVSRFVHRRSVCQVHHSGSNNTKKSATLIKAPATSIIKPPRRRKRESDVVGDVGRNMTRAEDRFKPDVTLIHIAEPAAVLGTVISLFICFLFFFE
jgi:hypothetical protein